MRNIQTSTVSVTRRSTNSQSSAWLNVTWPFLAVVGYNFIIVCLLFRAERHRSYRRDIKEKPKDQDRDIQKTF